MPAEAAGRLAGGEAEDRGADQAFGPGDLGLGQAAFAQRGLHRVADGPSRRGNGRPGQQQREDGGVPARGVPDPGGQELTPGGGDLLAGVPVALTALATLIRPSAWRYLAGGSTGAYSLTPAAWEELRRAAAAVGPGLPGD